MSDHEHFVAPVHWEKRVLAAYLLMMGDTWVATAAKVGRTEQTIANWKRHESWPAAKAEAERRWLYDIKDVARRAVYRQLSEGDGDLGLKILERLEDELAPKQNHVVTGKHGGPVQHAHVHHLAEALDAAIEEAYGHRNGHSTSTL